MPNNKFPKFQGIEHGAASHAKYPYVTIRIMSAVYTTKPIVFTSAGVSGFHKDYIEIVDPMPFNASGAITVEAQCAIADLVLEQVVAQKRSMCVVFAANKSIYVEYDGTMRDSDQPPSGGVLVDM